MPIEIVGIHIRRSGANPAALEQGIRSLSVMTAVTAVIALGIAALAVHEGREAWEGEEDDDD